MKTLFVREFKDHKIKKTTRQVEKGCEWVLKGEGYATEKIDGTCCLIKDGKIYRRFDYKKGRTLPPNAIPCQDKPDEITGHFPHWVLCDENNPQDKYHLEAFNKQKPLANGTYELIGKHFQNNPYNLDTDILVRHGSHILKFVPRNYFGIKMYLKFHNIEGIVFYRGNGEMCKIKRTDFGYKWKGIKK